MKLGSWAWLAAVTSLATPVTARAGESGTTYFGVEAAAGPGFQYQWVNEEAESNGLETDVLVRVGTLEVAVVCEWQLTCVFWLGPRFAASTNRSPSVVAWHQFRSAYRVRCGLLGWVSAAASKFRDQVFGRPGLGGPTHAWIGVRAF
jgi:hypothetical protein